MNALKRWNRLKDLETFQHGLESLLGRSPVHRPEGQEEPMAVAEWSPLVDISEDDKEYPGDKETLWPQRHLNHSTRTSDCSRTHRN